MELFAMFNTPPRIRKFITHGDLQAKLEHVAHAQISEFMSHEESYPFDGQYKPDPGEVLEITNFDDVDGLIETVKSPDDCVIWSPKDETPITEIKGFFFSIDIDGVSHVGIQNFDRRQVISNKFVLGWSKESFKAVDETALSLDNKVCSVLKETDGLPTLYFKSLHNVRRIFDMDAYYHAATIDEIEAFFNLEQFSGYNHVWLSENLDDWIRKTVTYISKEGVLENISAGEISKHAETVGLDIETIHDGDGSKIAFPENKKELKRLLRFLDEDIWMSPLTNNVYVSNSKRKFGR